MDNVYKQLKLYGKVKPNVLLSKFSNFNIGGPADFLIEVTETEKAIALLNYLSGEGIEYLILGGGSNVLFPDDGIRGVVIRIKNEELRMKNNVIEVDAGVQLSELVRASIEHKLAGLEWAAGIPGAVGGAIRGNAGAHYVFTGGEIKDSITSVRMWRDGEALELTALECEFGYRDSIFKHKTDVVLSGKFALAPGDAKKSLEMTQKIIAERKGKQSSQPSAGSFFKNVPLTKWKQDQSRLPARFLSYKKIAAGWLVEQAGLKGFRVGGAMISEEHGNFIINAGGATQADVLAVVDEVKQRVYTTYEIELEEEVQIIH